MCAVTAAPGPAGVRVWEVMSRGRGPRVGCPPPEGVDVAVDVAYPLDRAGGAHRHDDALVIAASGNSLRF